MSRPRPSIGQVPPAAPTESAATTQAAVPLTTSPFPSASAVGRAWPPLAALGAGLIHLAVAASAPAVLAVLLAVIGIAEVVWGVAVLRAGQPVLVRLALVVSSASSALWVAVAFSLMAVGAAEPAASVPLLPLVAATVFTLSVAVVCARSLRRADAAVVTASTGSASSAVQTAPAAPGAGGGWRFVGAFAASAALVSAIATPALAATEAGQYAHPHGEHSVELVVPGHEH
ncbi:hypothetical protein ASF62_16090 [Leifsonia sp. Leaf325]|nr:hypothetical protein [Leifsonia sp. Leaf325]KQQ93237.1 hypothetical protein ASF62_16090 [Leifsonia sp. Leaf325]